MQENAMAFQAIMEQDRVKFEADLSAKLQQQNSQFQMAMMQQSQLFQAELFRKLFDKKDSQSSMIYYTFIFTVYAIINCLLLLACAQ